jgi:hypothetical protein
LIARREAKRASAIKWLLGRSTVEPMRHRSATSDTSIAEGVTWSVNARSTRSDERHQNELLAERLEVRDRVTRCEAEIQSITSHLAMK